MAKKGFWDRAIEATPLGLSQMRWNQENARRNEELGMAREEHDRTMQGLDITRERDSLKLMAEQEAKAMADDTKRLRLSNYDPDVSVEILNKSLPANSNLRYDYKSVPSGTKGEESSVLILKHVDPKTGKEKEQTVAVCPTHDEWMANVNTLVWGEDYQRARLMNKLEVAKTGAEIEEKVASATEKRAGAKEKEAQARKHDRTEPTPDSEWELFNKAYKKYYPEGNDADLLKKWQEYKGEGKSTESDRNYATYAERLKAEGKTPAPKDIWKNKFSDLFGDYEEFASKDWAANVTGAAEEPKLEEGKLDFISNAIEGFFKGLVGGGKDKSGAKEGTKEDDAIRNQAISELQSRGKAVTPETIRMTMQYLQSLRK